MPGPAQADESDTVRAFVAVVVREDLRQCFAELRRAAEALVRRARWVRPERMHLTMAFLGNLTRRDLPGVHGAMERAVAGRNAFALRFAEPGCFPPSGRPRVLWVGAEEGKEALCELAEALRTGIREAGIAFDDKPFRPHLTIARLREGGDRGALLDKLARRAAGWVGKETLVDRLVLYQSELRPEGPRYTELHVARLTGPPSTGRT